jgi:hypothetical protein
MVCTIRPRTVAHSHQPDPVPPNQQQAAAHSDELDQMHGSDCRHVDTGPKRSLECNHLADAHDR